MVLTEKQDTNLILATDSYKLTHWEQYPKGTTKVYSYFESREGAEFPYTVFFGLQSIIKDFLLGEDRVTYAHIEEADKIAKAHFGGDLFNREGWEYIERKHRGKLPLKIRAVPEGTPVPTNNVLMTVENTDPKCWWLTNAVESLLTHVWYPSTIATLSRVVKENMAMRLDLTSDNGITGLPFMLHDFGYRGATSHESAAIGGAAHLVNFKGTDTLPAMQLALRNYKADLETLAFSVPATEHSVMTSLGREGEPKLVKDLIANNPSGILSVVGDSYNIYDFVRALGTDPLKDEVLARDGVFVVRPDSTTREHPSAGTLVCWILHQLWNDFGGETNSKGMKVLDSHVRVLWGDGLDRHKIEKMLGRVQVEGFSVENLVLGMGGGLLQKVDRDTQRFAFKCSAQERDGKWVDIFKDPIDSTKKSKKGRLRLAEDTLGNYETMRVDEADHDHIVNHDILETVYSNGYLMKNYTFDEVRKNAAISQELVV